MPTARSTPNIALIKYWGNRNEELRLPMADSLSMTLDHPTVEITLETGDRLAIHSFDSDGRAKTLTENQVSRWQKTLALCRRYLATLDESEVLPEKLVLTIRSHIPPSVGLASSAAVFSCLAKAIAGLVREQITLTDEQVSVLARLGSGSAARSIYGGFSALKAGEGKEIGSSAAIQIAPEDHWLLHDIVIIPSHDEKKVGSTEGHALASTSPFYEQRVEDIRRKRQPECVDAVLKRDFEKLQRVTEEDALDMHHVMETSTPSLKYLTADTHRIVAAIKDLRTKEHLPVLFTMDAGPTVHLLCTDEAKSHVLAFAHEQKGCTIYETKIGPGSTLLP
ncbi:MAG: diphosphomevalonate decarboxylase [Candidatus Peribacteraceae bacterium]|nr:diphosphomevalonate decarboxylase [Candidatus Peribacteraceae bacterium]MDD5074394.1 diphosphomevalonate decarboxylase [Candidatus Peribacteraceae bacterium]